MAFKIALVQDTPIVANNDTDLSLVFDSLEMAREQNANVIFFPNQSLTSDSTIESDEFITSIQAMAVFYNIDVVFNYQKQQEKLTLSIKKDGEITITNEKVPA